MRGTINNSFMRGENLKTIPETVSLRAGRKIPHCSNWVSWEGFHSGGLGKNIQFQVNCIQIEVSSRHLEIGNFNLHSERKRNSY